MKRSTLFLGLAGTAASVGLILWGLFWFYRIPSVPAGVSGKAGNAISEEDLVSVGPFADGIPSIDTPDFERVAAADRYLKDAGFGLDVEVGGAHRFYPYQVLVWHEVANDTFGDESIAVTYDPLTLSGRVFSRVVDGQVLTFRPSGQVWNNNLVMTDAATGTRWSQLRGTSLDGATALETIPAIVMRWSDWKYAYPDGEVLSRNTGFVRDYTLDPYGNYQDSPEIWYPLTRYDSRLAAKERVYGVVVGGESLAVPAAFLRDQGTVRKTMGGLPISVVYDKNLDAARAFVTNADGSEGAGVPVIPSFWFAWAAAFPDTQLEN